MNSDLLGSQLSTTEEEILVAYESLKRLVEAPDLAPTSASNLRDALASVSIVVTGSFLDYENLIDLGC